MNRSISKLSMIPLIQRAAHNRGLIFGGIILVALLAFEIFNYSSTAFALQDILGDLAFGPFKWATILAIAFCSIDFAGIARIFTPERGRDEPAEVWYLFGAWLLAAGFNATLTWWGVSVAIVSHNSASGSAVVSAATMTKVVPVFVAAMILLVRVLIIGTFSLAGDRLFTTDDRRARSYSGPRPAQQSSYSSAPSAALRPASSLSRPPQSNTATFRPAPKVNTPQQTSFSRQEPTYHNLYGQSNNDRNDRSNDKSYDL